MNRIVVLMVLWCGLLLTGCKRSFQPIDFGREACGHCRMTILDPRFAAELIDRKGKVFKFDDIACMKKFIREQQMQESDLLLFVGDYEKGGKEFLDARKAYFVQSEAFASPMNGNSAAFPSPEAARNHQQDKEAKLTDWATLQL